MEEGLAPQLGRRKGKAVRWEVLFPFMVKHEQQAAGLSCQVPLGLLRAVTSGDIQDLCSTSAWPQLRAHCRPSSGPPSGSKSPTWAASPT